MIKYKILRVAVVICMGFHASVVQGGPPLLTDDPDTPGDRNWEINLAYITEKRESNWEHEAPLLDINYGWGERIQLKYEVPWLLLDERGSSTKSGLGNSEVGVKWRFLDEERHGLSLSMYPQFEFNNPTSSEDRGLVDDGLEYLLPFQFSRTIGPMALYLELGHAWRQHRPDEWIYGLALGYPISDTVEFMGEIYGVAERDFEEEELVFNLGGKWEFHQHGALLFTAGRSFRESSSGEPAFLS